MLRPFVMSFVTTALAPSPALFTDGRDPRQRATASASPTRPTRRRSRCPISPTRSPTSCSTRASPRKFSAWPHFISTAPGVAYAYVDDYRRNRPDVFMAGADAREAGGRSRHADRVAGQDRGAAQRDGRQPTEARRRPLCGARPGARRVRARRGRPRRRRRASRAGRAATSPSPASTPPARPARAACCSRATATTWPGPSPPAAAPAATPPSAPPLPTPLPDDGVRPSGSDTIT